MEWVKILNGREILLDEESCVREREREREREEKVINLNENYTLPP